jgi:hypothetical protein
LEDGNTEADDDEAHDEGDDGCDGGFKTLVEDLIAREMNNIVWSNAGQNVL